MDIEKVRGVSRERYDEVRRMALECAATPAERKWVEELFAVLKTAAEVAEEDPRVRQALEEAQDPIRRHPDPGGPDA